MNNLIILGNFDGVHIGHQKLIKEAIKYAKNNNLNTIVYTFSTLPSNKKYITTVEERVELLKDLKVDEVYIDDFYKIKNYTPEQFVLEILKLKLKAKKVFCGYNYTFGYNKSGNVETLKNLIDTTVIEEVKYKDISVSSSYIRELIKKGDFDNVKHLLGRSYKLCGTVIHGKKLGRQIGFPTANFIPNDLKVCPPAGVYGTKIKLENQNDIFLSITNIGYNPTIDKNNFLTVETNIFNFNDDIYSKKIEVFFEKLIRLEKKFVDLDDLKKQISLDKKLWGNIND